MLGQGFDERSIKRIERFVIDSERTSVNNPLPERRNKYGTPGKAPVKFGLTDSLISNFASGSMACRIEKVPIAVEFDDPNGNYGTVGGINGQWCPSQWYPVFPAPGSSGSSFLSAVQTTNMVGVYGTLESFSASSGILEINDGDGGDLSVNVIESGNGSLPPPQVGVKGYAVRLSSYSPGNPHSVSADYELVLQPCGGP